MPSECVLHCKQVVRRAVQVEIEAAGSEGTSVRVTLAFTPAHVTATVSAVSRFHRDKKRAIGAHYGADQGSIPVNDEPDEAGAVNDMGLSYALGPDGTRGFARRPRASSAVTPLLSFTASSASSTSASTSASAT